MRCINGNINWGLENDRICYPKLRNDGTVIISRVTDSWNKKEVKELFAEYCRYRNDGEVKKHLEFNEWLYIYMKELSYIPKKKINFDDYLSPSLDLNSVRKGADSIYICCASAAISMLTNKHPFAVDIECKNPFRGWRTRPIIKYLREQGFVVIELTKQTILDTHWSKFPLKPEHCLLINCRVNNSENSMVIAHKGEVWHNYKKEPNPSLFFLSKPTQDVLLVYNEKWKAKKPYKIPKLDTKNKRILF